jgi:hypothetical protein
MKKKVSYKHNSQGKRYAYVSLPNELVKGKEIELIEIDDTSILLVFK